MTGTPHSRWHPLISGWLTGRTGESHAEHTQHSDDRVREGHHQYATHSPLAHPRLLLIPRRQCRRYMTAGQPKEPTEERGHEHVSV
jgi:hypothetical protein